MFLRWFVALIVTVGGANAVIAAPTITSFAPTSGPVGTPVTITGTNFSTGNLIFADGFESCCAQVGLSNTVKFNGTTATILSATTTQLVVTVPEAATTGTITGKVGTQTATSSSNFTVTVPPTITSFLPTSGPPGTVVTITGTNFSTTPADDLVTFLGGANPQEVSVTAATTTQLTVIIPEGVDNSPNGLFQVTVAGLSATSAGYFTLTSSAPTISSFNPTSGPVGTVVTITGTHFLDAETYASEVTFNATLVVNVISWSSTSIIATVPAGASSGTIEVNNGISGTAVSGSSFTVIPPPTITGFNPGTGPVGTSVTITGTNFSTTALSNTVTFNGTAAVVTSASTTQLTVTVPNGATTGPLSVTVDGQTATSVSSFTVTLPPPTITGFSPINGPVGATVTITGTHFSPVASSNNVTFNGTPTTVTLAGSGQLMVTVPVGATSGTIQVNVVGQIATSGSTFTVTSGVSGGGAATTLYTYDGNNRLRSVTNAAGTSADYVYDALGNLLDVGTVAAGQLAIFGFTPNFGSVGTPVTIQGQGFSTLAANDNVSFNGTTASVTGATASQLTATVPGGASSGPIAITVSGHSVTSSDSFAVIGGSVDQTPLISGLMPTSGSVGTVITVTGSHFLPVTGQTSVYLGATQVVPTSLTDTQIVFAVPENQGSGFIDVVTPYGQATSVTPLTVALPLGVVLSSTLPLPVGGAAQTLTLSGAGTSAAYWITPQANGSWLSIQVSTLTTTPSGGSLAYTLYAPNNTPIATGFVSSTSMSIHLPPTTMTGIYQLVFSTGTKTAASMTAALTTDPVVSVNGASMNDSITTAGQTKRYVFSGGAQQTIGIGLTELTFTPATVTNMYVTVTSQDGTTILTGAGGGAVCMLILGESSYGCALSLLLPIASTYGLIIGPAMNATTSYTLTLSSATQAASIAPGPPTAVGVSRPGQDELVSFTAPAGQATLVQLSGISTTPSGASVPVNFLDPLLNTLASTSSQSGVAFYIQPATTSTYFVQIGGTGVATPMSAQVYLDPGTSVAVDGATVNVSTTLPGQSVRLNFAATAGQSVALAITGLVMAPIPYEGSTEVSVTLVNPDGTGYPLVVSETAYCQMLNDADGGCSFNLSNLPQTGTYTLILTPAGSPGYVATATWEFPATNSGSTLTAAVTLSTDLTDSVVAGTPTLVNLTRPGQNESVTFSATTGQPITLDITNIATIPRGQSLAASVLDPTGTLVASGSYSGSLVFYVYPQTTGTYTLLINAIPTVSGNEGLALIASAQVLLSTGAPLAVNAAATPVSISTPGQAVQFNFTAVAGQTLGLGLSGVSINPATDTNVLANLYNPDGTLFAPLDGLSVSHPCNWWVGTGCGWNLNNLPQTGTYTLVILPNDRPQFGYPSVMGTQQVDAVTMNANLILSSELTMALAPNISSTVTLAQPGQNVALTFAATAGQAAVVEISNSATTPVGEAFAATLWDPTGDALISDSTCAQGMMFYVNPTVTGTYSIELSITTPPGLQMSGATGSTQAILDTGTTLAANGPAVSISTATLGQSVRLNFAGTMGQHLTLSTTGVMLLPFISPSDAIAMVLLNPDGSLNGRTSCGSSCHWTLSALPQTGTYTWVAYPAGATGGTAGTINAEEVGVGSQLMSANITLTSP